MHTAIVTGAAKGIGRAISLKLMEEEIFVILIDKDREALADFIENCPHPDKAVVLQMDVSHPENLMSALQDIQKKYSNIKYLVNNAGISVFKAMEDLTFSQWRTIIDTNLSSAFVSVKVLASTLKKNKGSVVNISSTRAYMSEAHSEAYAASKGGILALTHAQAMSLGPDVKVNSISPGWIDVRAWQNSDKEQLPDWDAKHHEQHPAGRIGKPEDVAELCWFLLSDKSGFITGQDFIADGGMTRKMIYKH